MNPPSALHCLVISFPKSLYPWHQHLEAGVCNGLRCSPPSHFSTKGIGSHYGRTGFRNHLPCLLSDAPSPAVLQAARFPASPLHAACNLLFLCKCSWQGQQHTFSIDIPCGCSWWPSTGEPRHSGFRSGSSSSAPQDGGSPNVGMRFRCQVAKNNEQYLQWTTSASHHPPSYTCLLK